MCLAIGVAGIGSSGCGVPAAEPAKIDTLRLGGRDTPEARAVLTNFLFAERLVTIDWHGRPEWVLATGLQWQDDGRTLEVTLRPGVTFHDGTPLTAEVVAGILRQVRKRDLRRPFGGVRSFDALNEHTLAIRLTRPDAFLGEAIADTLIVDPAKPDIGTGPFRLVTRTPSIKAERYTAYYRGMPGIDKVEVKTYDTQRAAWVAMMRNEVDMVQEVNRDSAEFLEGA